MEHFEHLWMLTKRQLNSRRHHMTLFVIPRSNQPRDNGHAKNKHFRKGCEIIFNSWLPKPGWIRVNIEDAHTVGPLDIVHLSVSNFLRLCMQLTAIPCAFVGYKPKEYIRLNHNFVLDSSSFLKSYRKVPLCSWSFWDMVCVLAICDSCVHFLKITHPAPSIIS